MNASLTLTAAPTRRFSLNTVTRRLPGVARFAMGALFLMCGLDGFLHFLPQPTDPAPEGAMALGVAFMKSGYLMQLISGTEAIAGALLVSNRFVALGLVLLAPVLVNILAFHLFLAPAGLGLALVLVSVELVLAWNYRSAYRPLLTARAPTVTTADAR